MPLLLGFSAVLRFLIGLVPLLLGYFASFLAKISTKTGLIAAALSALITAVILELIGKLSHIIWTSIPPDYSHLMASYIPGNLNICLDVIIFTRITIFVFDLKEKFLNYASRTF